MKHYLDLIPISAHIHKRQNRMTLLCIIFAVFLVTTIFSMADMGVRMEQTRLMHKHGHLGFHDLSGSATFQTLYFSAAILFILILAAGVLMISSSINSNVSQRTKFFGIMRCIGMSKQQIIRFVRLEALYWCKTAIPIGVFLGVAATWVLCMILHFFVGGEMAEIPLFKISIPGIASGAITGVITVLLAARSPAKRAAKISPVSAASGIFIKEKDVRRGSNFHFFKIETAMGIHHALSSKKNLALMTGSFALSIILFLSFSVFIDFVGYLIPQSSSAADIVISSRDASNSIDSELLNTLRRIDGVQQVFGRRSSFDVPAELLSASPSSHTIDIVAFDDFDLDCLSKDGALQKDGDIAKVYGNSKYVLAVPDNGSLLKTGEKIKIAGEQLEIAGQLKYDPFSSDGTAHGKITLITSGETFQRLTGINNYSLVMIQTAKNITEQNVSDIRVAAGGAYTFSDKREQNTSDIYTAFLFFVYGFLIIIALVTLLNIMNSISMSVSARIRLYGTMRAVGMDQQQLTKMITAEAFTYAFCGCLTGCAIGLCISKLFYDILIASHFSYASWHFPVTPLLIILFFICFAAAAAIYHPSKRIRKLSVTDVINEL